MPYKRRFKRKPRKRTYSRKKKYVTPISRQMGLGTSHIAKLRYCDEISLNAAANGIDKAVFLANGLFAPRVAGGGHQPYGFDQLCPTLYDHFTVIGSTIKVQWVRASADTSVIPGWCGVLLSDNGITSTASSNVHHLLESYNAGSVQAVGWVGAPSGSSVMPQTRKSFSAKKFFKKPNIIGSSQYQGTYTADPTEKAYYEVYCGAMSGLDPGAIDALVTIEYIAVFTEPKRMAQS